MRASLTIAALAALGLVARPGRATEPARGPVLVVVAEQCPLFDITQQDLRHAFSGERVWVGEQRLIPLHLPSTAPAHAAFETRVFGMSHEQLGRFWLDRRIRGEGLPPRAMSSVAAALTMIARVPCAVGYVPLMPVPLGLRALRVEGRAYGDAAYLLR